MVVQLRNAALHFLLLVQYAQISITFCTGSVPGAALALRMESNIQIDAIDGMKNELRPKIETLCKYDITLEAMKSVTKKIAQLEPLRRGEPPAAVSTDDHEKALEAYRKGKNSREKERKASRKLQRGKGQMLIAEKVDMMPFFSACVFVHQLGGPEDIRAGVLQILEELNDHVDVWLFETRDEWGNSDQTLKSLLEEKMRIRAEKAYEALKYDIEEGEAKNQMVIPKKAKKKNYKQPKPAQPQDLPGPEQCTICADSIVTTVFSPCGHSVACNDCAQRIMSDTGKCPICRTSMKVNNL
jgi:hypothetical protein